MQKAKQPGRYKKGHIPVRGFGVLLLWIFVTTLPALSFGGIDFELGMQGDKETFGGKFRMAWFALDREDKVWAIQPVFFYQWDDKQVGDNKLGVSIGTFFRTTRWGAGVFYDYLGLTGFEQDVKHEQIGLGLEYRFRYLEARFNGYFPFSEEQFEGEWFTEEEDQQFFFASYQKAVPSFDIEMGGILAPRLRVYGIFTWMDGVDEEGIVADAYEDDATKAVFGGGGRFDYEFSSNLRLKVRFTANRVDQRGTLSLAIYFPRKQSEPELSFTGHDIHKVWERDEEVKYRRYQRVSINNSPSCDAGQDQTVEIGTTVQLSGSASDPDGDPLTYLWTFDSKPVESAAALSNATTLNPSFTVDVPGIYLVRLTVSDGLGSSYDTVEITGFEPEEEFEDVRIYPSSAEVDPYGTIQFRASGGDGNYTYSFVQNGSEDGSIDPQTGFYEAGCFGDSYDIIRVRDGRGDYADATVYVRPGG